METVYIGFLVLVSGASYYGFRRWVPELREGLENWLTRRNSWLALQQLSKATVLLIAVCALGTGSAFAVQYLFENEIATTIVACVPIGALMGFKIEQWTVMWGIICRPREEEDDEE